MKFLTLKTCITNTTDINQETKRKADRDSFIQKN